MSFLIARLRSHQAAIPLLILLVMIGGALIVNARSQQQPYPLARDLPRSPLVYAQFSDLPDLLNRWHSSQLKADYLNSVNYEQLQRRRLAIRIAERFSEFSAGLGFELDSNIFKSIAVKEAAIGLYDIGRIDAVFIAPISIEQLAASQFLINKDSFNKRELPDGTTYYQSNVDADRGRQNQSILFATVRGKFVLATNEGLMLRALSNINGNNLRDRLSDEPAFQRLSGEMIPHFATIWVDQQRLNQDYYFRNYWVMKNVDQLAQLRAGIFDLELGDDRWVERRDFLINGNQQKIITRINNREWQQVQQLIPTKIPFYQFQVARDEQTTAQLIRDTLFEPRRQQRQPRSARWDQPRYSYYAGEVATYYDSEPQYRYFDHDFGAMINNAVDAELIGYGAQPDYQEIYQQATQNFTHQLAQALVIARPQSIVTLQSPQAEDWPLFAEFRRAAIINLTAPINLNNDQLQSAINSLVAGQLLIAGADRASIVALQWQQRSVSGQYQWQELELPMLGWSLCYALRGEQLIIANSVELLQSMLSNQQQRHGKRSLVGSNSSAMTELTVISFEQRAAAFDQIFTKLSQSEIDAYSSTHSGSNNERSQEFFTGNIGGLLDLISDVSSVEIKRNRLAGRQQEEITIHFNKGE